MHRVVTRTVAAAVFASAVAGAGAASAAELVYGAGIPAKAEELTLGVQPYLDDVSKRTKGEITFKMVAGAQLVSLPTTLAGLRDGAIDAGFVIPTFTRKELKHINILYDTEIFGNDVAAITGAANEFVLLHCPECLKDFADNNGVFVASFSNTQKGLICRKPVKTLADLKGLKIRGIGATTRLIEALGAVPVVMSPPEATTALGNGTIDCAHALASWLKNFGFQDVAKYLVEGNFGAPRVASHSVFRRAVWDKFTPEQKKAAIDAAPAGVARLVYNYGVDGDKRIVEDAVKNHGVQVIKAGKDIEDAIEAFRKKDMVENPKINATALGVPGAQKIFDDFLKVLDKWEKIAAETNMKNDVAKMTEIYKKEIYDKVDPSKL